VFSYLPTSLFDSLFQHASKGEKNSQEEGLVAPAAPADHARQQR